MKKEEGALLTKAGKDAHLKLILAHEIGQEVDGRGLGGCTADVHLRAGLHGLVEELVDAWPVSRPC